MDQLISLICAKPLRIGAARPINPNTLRRVVSISLPCTLYI